MTAIKSSSSKSMGDLLLKGWAMLAENCPSCQVPLMRDPKSRDRLCVNCDHTYPDGQELESPEDDADLSSPDDEDDTANEQQLPASEQGHTSNSAIAQQDAAPWRRKQESDKVSELLSDKMLQGWALLETSCPRCRTPLVRNKEKRMMCVLCQSWVIPEAELQAKNQTQASTPSTEHLKEQQPDSRAALGSSSRLTVQQQTVAASAPSPKRNLPPALGQPVLRAAPSIASPVAPALGRVDAQTSPLEVPNGTAAGFAVSLAPSAQLLSLLASSLNNQLWQAQRLLDSTLTSDSAAVCGYASVVSDCLDALAKVRLEARQQQP